ncbi:MAG: hypothetical protein KDD42_00615 [Bdellovibrionales bacterium]|nr:hypothetical protein [Bdellovibrionales bacterium]
MPEPKSLSHTLEELATVYGITESLHIGENGTLRDDQDHIINPTELEVVKTFRFEGESNPSDMSILLVLRSKSDAQHSLTATLVAPFGASADTDSAKAISSLEHDL